MHAVGGILKPAFARVNAVSIQKTLQNHATSTEEVAVFNTTVADKTTVDDPHLVYASHATMASFWMVNAQRVTLQLLERPRNAGSVRRGAGRRPRPSLAA